MVRPIDEFEKQQIKKIGMFFSQLRYKQGKTQRDIGLTANIGQAAVTYFEKADRGFHFSTLLAMARAYGYRVQISLVPIEGGDPILVEPDPDIPVSRVYSNGTVMVRKKRAPRKPRNPTGPILPGPQVQYENEDEFDTQKEMAALRARLGMS